MSTELRPAKNGQTTAIASSNSASPLWLLAGADGNVGSDVFSFLNGMAIQGRSIWNTNTTAAASATRPQWDSIEVRAP
ncbi:hypothetical protein G6F35_018970 [Rhizopus arrhizus]|nr:hypothetical protein G6F31_021446 [Rhizopus arrhizus]KAG1165092.1 hypothetical protein G6F35_018970 [Rhizopus arrhizus]